MCVIHYKIDVLTSCSCSGARSNDSGETLSLAECAARFFFATLSFSFIGLGFVWILFDPDRLAWHDRASGSRVVFLGKDAYKNGTGESSKI